MRPETCQPAQHIRLEELEPSLELTACYDFSQDHWFHYRVASAHFLLVKSGHIEGRTPTETVHAHAGDILCFRFADHNQYGTLGRTEFYEAHVKLAPPPQERRTVWLEGVGPLPQIVKLGNAFDAMRQVFDTFNLELNQPGPAHRARVSAALWEMLALLAEAATRQNRPSKTINEWQRARMRLESEMSARLQVCDVAAELGLSVDHFIRGFKKRFGISPKQCRTQALLRHAAHRLTTEDVPIKRLAFDLGFADAYSFTRTFKQHLGILPTQLREGLSISERAPRTSMPKWSGQSGNDPRQIFKINEHVLPHGVGAELYQKFIPIM